MRAAPSDQPAVTTTKKLKPTLVKKTPATPLLRAGYESGYTRSDNRVSATTWPADVKLFTKTIESYCFGDAVTCYMTDDVAMWLTSFSLYRLRRARKGADAVGEVAFKLGDGRGQATEYTLLRKTARQRVLKADTLRVLKADTFRAKTRHLYPGKGYQNTPPSKEGVEPTKVTNEGERSAAALSPASKSSSGSAESKVKLVSVAPGTALVEQREMLTVVKASTRDFTQYERDMIPSFTLDVEAGRAVTGGMLRVFRAVTRRARSRTGTKSSRSTATPSERRTSYRPRSCARSSRCTRAAWA